MKAVSDIISILVASEIKILEISKKKQTRNRIKNHYIDIIS